MSFFHIYYRADTVTRVKIPERELIIVGTAHTSMSSKDQVADIIQKETPSTVCVEIDETRANRLQGKVDDAHWDEDNIHNIIKSGKGFLLLTNLILSSYQKRLGGNLNIQPGAEMLKAIELSQELNIPVVMCDRGIELTLKRAWRLSNPWEKTKLVAILISSIFSRKSMSEDEIEKIKTHSELDELMEEADNFLPKAKEVLINERDIFMAHNILNTEGDKVIAVVGAGHVPGILKTLEAIIIGIMVYAFKTFGAETGFETILTWFLVNGIFAATGAIIALAHPVTILVAFSMAAITSLNPALGVGLFTGTVEYFFRKPHGTDLEQLPDDVMTLKGWYKNRFTRILLVFFLPAIGNTVGTIVAGLMIGDAVLGTG